MPLSLVQEAVTTTPPVYDSGWVDVQGNSTITVLENFSFDKDVMLYIFAFENINTVANQWELRVPDANGNTKTITKWRKLDERGDTITEGTNAFRDRSIYVNTTANNPTVSQAQALENMDGAILLSSHAGTFQSTSSANTGQGITYRAIAVELKADDLLARLK